MNPVSRALVFLVAAIVAAGLHSLGVLEALERTCQDRLVQLAPHLRADEAFPVAAFRVDDATGAKSISAAQAIEALKRLGRIRCSTAVIALPDPVPADYATAAQALARALAPIGRTVLVLGRGDRPAPPSARLVREGRGPDLVKGPGIADISSLHEFVDTATRTSVADIEPDGDGVVREFAVAYGPLAETTPSLPVAVAACTLKESSLRFSPDLMTLESFGGRDIDIAAPNTLRFKMHRERIFRPVPLEAGALDAIAVDSDSRDARFPVVFVAFAGSPLLDELTTPLRDLRTGLEIVADATNDLLAGDTLHEPAWRITRAIIVIVPFVLGVAPLFVRRRRTLALLLAASYALTTCLAASLLSLLLPIAPIGIALLLGTVGSWLLGINGRGSGSTPS